MKKAKLLVVLIATVLAISMLASCVPRGFNRDFSPKIVRISDSEIIVEPLPNIASQFHELNGFEHYRKDGYYFILNDYEYTILFRQTYPGSGLRVGATVYRHSDKKVEIGQFVKITERWQTHRQYASFGLPFLVENYLYYNLGRTKIGFHLSGGLSAGYSKEEFYRFNLNTGENEKVSLTQFVEALQKIDSNWVIDPSYRGER